MAWQPHSAAPSLRGAVEAIHLSESRFNLRDNRPRCISECVAHCAVISKREGQQRIWSGGQFDCRGRLAQCAHDGKAESFLESGKGGALGD